MESSSLSPDSPVRHFFSTFYQKFKNWSFVTTPGSQPLLRSYLTLRSGIGIIGVALPPVLVIGAMILNLRLEAAYSLSAYYYSVMGSVFVGSLWAIGIFLICYRYDRLDDIISTIAGVCAIFVSLFPTTPEGVPTTPQQDTIATVHFLFAAGFLVALALMVLFLFTRKNPEKDKVTDSDRKRKLLRNKIYVICGSAMVLLILVAGAIRFVPFLHDASWLQLQHPLLIIETLATWAFGIAWFVKGETLGRLKGAIQRRSHSGQAESGNSVEPSQPAVEQSNGFPAASSQPAVDGQ